MKQNNQETPINSRRNFLQSLTGLGGATLAGSLLPASLQASPLLAPADPLAGHVFTATPYLQHTAPDSMVVMCITNLPAIAGLSLVKPMRWDKKRIALPMDW